MEILSLVDDAVTALQAIPLWVFITIAIAAVFYRPTKRTKHYFKIRSSKRCLAKLISISDSARQFGYLRKVDPFVFEEMILTAFEQLGYQIERNSKYTGDGGIDGRVVINGRKTLIQAKRYKNHINAAHVAEFSECCKQTASKGLFVHTGKTGKQSRSHAATGDIHIISGNQLLDILVRGTFKPRW